MAQEAVEERIDIVQIFLQHPVIHPTGEQGAACHQEELFYGIGNITGQIFRKFRTGNVVKPIFSPGVGKCAHIGLGSEHTCGEKLRVASAGNIHRAVRKPLADIQKLPQNAVHLIQTGFQEDQFGIPATMAEKGSDLFLTCLALRDLGWT